MEQICRATAPTPVVLPAAGPPAAPAAPEPSERFDYSSASTRPLKPEEQTALAQTPEMQKSEVFLDTPQQAVGYQVMFDHGAPVEAVGVAGYSAAPEGYVGPSTQFLHGLHTELASKLGTNKAIEWVTSPTATPKSIDSLVTLESQRDHDKEAFVTADGFLPYVQTKDLDPNINLDQFTRAPKLVLHDNHSYSTAFNLVAKDGLILMGGRDQAVFEDLQNAVTLGHNVVVVRNPAVGSKAWDPTKTRVDNGSEYVAAFASGNPSAAGIDMSHPKNQAFAKFWSSHESDLSQHLLLVDASDPAAARQAVDFLTR